MGKTYFSGGTCKKKSKRKVVKAVKNLSFEVRSGEVFGLLGPNGAGKTTSIQILTAEESPSHGNVSNCCYESLISIMNNILKDL